MGNLTQDEKGAKLDAANKAIDELIALSKGTNKCTVPAVVALAKEMLVSSGLKEFSPSTIKQPQTSEWEAIKDRIDKHRQLYSKSKVKLQGIYDDYKELEKLSENQNTKILEYLCNIEVLEKKNSELEEEIVTLVQQLHEFKAT